VATSRYNAHPLSLHLEHLNPEQLAAFLSLDIADEHIELLLSDNCVLCHTNPDQQPEETLFRVRDLGEPNGHLNLREVVADVHLRRGLSCSGCHGGKPTDEEMPDEIFDRWPDRDARRTDRSWIPAFCTEACHSQTGFMRRFNPSLPVDQMLKYRESRHGDAVLTRRNPQAAQCVSCHGVHGIRRPTSPQSLVFPANIPTTCGKCHADREFMRGRIVFPCLDGEGRVVHLAGRKWASFIHPRAPKYLSLYGLPKPLYGLAQIKPSGEPALFTESLPDWLTLLQWGHAAICNLGTGLTPTHVDVLRRLGRPLVYVPQNDASGVGLEAVAAWREMVGRGAVLELPQGVKDVNELAVAGRRDEFLVSLSQATRS